MLPLPNGSVFSGTSAAGLWNSGFFDSRFPPGETRYGTITNKESKSSIVWSCYPSRDICDNVAYVRGSGSITFNDIVDCKIIPTLVISTKFSIPYAKRTDSNYFWGTEWNNNFSTGLYIRTLVRLSQKIAYGGLRP